MSKTDHVWSLVSALQGQSKSAQAQCIHCGLPEKKHLGPHQWCPRRQPIGRGWRGFLNSFVPCKRGVDFGGDGHGAA